MDKFVVGFAFNMTKTKILLVKKRRPKWQEGCLNGIGGKIEDGEQPFDAMRRETLEEAGLELEWVYRGIMTGINNDGEPFECHIFYAYSNQILQFKQIEDELLGLYSPLTFHQYHKYISNLRYLIPYGMCEDGSYFMTLQYG
jgi:8-oxo-dGTP diphosphatase